MNTLIRNAHVISMDGDVGELQGGDVLISGDRIEAVGVNLNYPEDTVIVDASGKFLIPGLVNAHIHLWQTLLRGVATDWTAPNYMKNMHRGLATLFQPDDIRISNLAGALNQIDSGTTTVVDWCHNNPTGDHTDGAIEGLEEAGIRALFLHGSPKSAPGDGQKHFSEIPMARKEIERLRKGKFSGSGDTLSLGLAILGPAYSTYATTREDMLLAKELGLIASMHVGGGAMVVPDGFEKLAEVDLLLEGTNVVHGNNLSNDTLGLALDRGVSVTVTAETELQMGFGNPLTGRLRAMGAPVSIGPDIESAVSGDMFATMRLTLQHQRNLDNLPLIEKDGFVGFEVPITCEEALRWATIDGAKMAQLDTQIGSITPGKKADLVLLDRRMNMSPLGDAASAIVLHANSGNVESVMIDGRFHKRAFKLTYENCSRVLATVDVSRERILSEFANLNPT
jgi:cytosine/adenosine deaminase-related metal-dependent hydrolase